jgi:aminoglycoside phosphotransferase (APT) family kinase protein
MTNHNSVTIDRSNMFYWQVDRPFDARETKTIFLDRYQNFDINQAKKAVNFGLHKSGLTGSGYEIIEIKPPGKVFSSVNVIYYITVKNGQRFLIRIHPPGVKNGYFFVESEACMLAISHGVPTYHTIYIDDTQSEFPFDYMIIEVLPGKTMQLVTSISPEIDHKLVIETGAYLAKIHSVNTQKYGFFDNQIAKEKHQLIGIHGNWKDHIYAAFEHNLDFLTDQKVISNSDRNKIETIYSQHEDLIFCNQPVLVHNDLADWNQLSDGAHVTGIIDWDECFSGDPVMDFAAWSVFFPYERMEFLKTGYKSVAPLPDGFTEKLHLYRLRYIVSKGVSRRMKTMIVPDPTYLKLLDYALQIMQDEFNWFGV